MADHNSTLDETLDVRDSETMSQSNSYYRQITREARVKEREAYESVGITDAWPIVHEEAEDATKVLTYPARKPRRRIDRVSVDWTLQYNVTGAYTTMIGKSDHLGVVVRLDPDVDGMGTNRRTLQCETIKTSEFQEKMR